MDSEDSREPAARASSDGEGSDDSGSPRRASLSPRGSIKNAGRRSNPQSPQSVDGPASPDERSQSYRSDQNSDVNSPENFRPSPNYEPKNGSESGLQSPPSRNDSPFPERQSPARSVGNPSSPNPSSLPASPQLDSPTDSDLYYKRTNKNSSDKKWSPKSDSRSRQNSVSSDSNRKPESGPSSPKKSQSGNDSDSSRSSPELSLRTNTKQADNPPTEEISDGDMEFDHEEKQPREKATDSSRSSKRDKRSDRSVDISHEDLSDVSDLESTGLASEDDSRPTARKNSTSGAESSNVREPTRETKADLKINGGNHEDNDSISSATKLSSHKVEQQKYEKLLQEKTNKTEDVEEQLDFEAEEGECLDPPPTSRLNNIENKNYSQNDKQKKEDDEGSGAASSLEEGEVSDDEDRRPEETEPRPVCRFYSRGQCTWGVSCRFLHPGVTDKGNYTMFDMVRTMPASGYNQPGHLHPHLPVGAQHHSMLQVGARAEPAPAESAWERGLRTAKEMMRKACKRKEQDTDFEEKKMHLSLSGGAGRGGSLGPGEEHDPDLAAYAGFPPPSSPVVKREKEEYIRIPDRRTQYDDIGRGYNARDRGYEKIARASISPPPRRGGLGSHGYDDKNDDKGLQKPRRGRTTREVIVQRATATTLGGGRDDEWADPWMRGGGGGGGANRSPVRRPRGRDKTRRRRRGYSSRSSYSSSSSSRSSSRSSNSSAKSGSLGRKRTRRRPHSPAKPRRAALSPSVIVQERRAATARAVAMNPPAPSSRKRVPSPAAIRQNAANPPAPHTKSSVDEFGRTKPQKPRQRKMYSKSSSSDSSSSSSDSDSESCSSSSSDSSRGRNKVTQRGLGSGAGGGGTQGGGGGAGGGGTGGAGGGGGLDKKQAVKISSGTRLLSPKYIADAQKKEAAEKARNDVSNVKKRPATSPITDAAPAKKPVSRREELLKQLKAVEEAIARKRSKI